MSQSPTELAEFDYESSYADAAKQLNKLVRAGKSYSGHERNCCFLNVTGDRFANVSMVSGFDFAEDGRAIAICDWDGDGDQDFWVANRTAPQLRFMRNDLGDKQAYIRFRLQGTTSNRDAVGARVKVQLTSSSVPLQKTVRAGGGFLTCHSKLIHFGISDATGIASVEVTWPSGAIEGFRGCDAVNATYLLKEGSGMADQLQSRRQPMPLSTEELDVPLQEFATQNVLLEPAPVPPLIYKPLSGNPIDAAAASNKPTLISLWAAWCQPCLKELAAWSSHYDSFEEHVSLLAISVDDLSVDDQSVEDLSEKADADPQAILTRLGFRGQAGLATPQMLDTLQQLHNVIYDHHRPLPLPCSFLLDENGSLRAIYKGAVSSERLLSDIKSLDRQSNPSLLPFPGRWLGEPGLHNLTLLVEELFREGYEQEANAYVERLIGERWLPTQVRSRLFLAEQLATREPRTAVRHASEVLKVEPKNSSAHERLGLIYARGGDLRQAQFHFEQAIANADPPQARTHFNFGRLLRNAKLAEKAKSQFERAIGIDPAFDRAYEQLGLIAASTRQFAEAAQYFATAKRLQPGKDEYPVNLAMALTQMDKNAEAWEAVRPVVQQSTAPPMALLLGARSLGNLERYGEAIPLLERFLQKEPNADDVRKQLQFMQQQAERQSAKNR